MKGFFRTLAFAAVASVATVSISSCCKHDEEEEKNFIPVEDEDELNQVYDIFKERNKENFDFID